MINKTTGAIYVDVSVAWSQLDLESHRNILERMVFRTKGTR